MIDEQPRRLLLDAGPLIALLYAPDQVHTTAVAGFGQLEGADPELLAPLPIVFEVYKWLSYETHPAMAREGLARMQETLEILYPTPDDLDDVVSVLDSM